MPHNRYTVINHVSVVCNLCNWREADVPMDQVQAKVVEHNKTHAAKTKGKPEPKVESNPHDLNLIVRWIDTVEPSGYAKCSCGWRSKDAKLSALTVMAHEHTDQLASQK